MSAEDGFYSAILDSSLGKIMIFVVPKSCQINLKNVVAGAYSQECKFVTFINFTEENQTPEDRIKAVYENGEDLVLLNIVGDVEEQPTTQQKVDTIPEEEAEDEAEEEADDEADDEAGEEDEEDN